ncbi:MAG: V-type ATPase subunit [Sulfolobaceae archaeon]|jgi:vacuolar-type H+-ATPase subunit C/Vma6|nr:V-type ATPase subunit [Sulfolobaceae archaeon]
MSFAYATALARVYKSQILSTGTVNELLESSSWKEVANILREKGIISEVPQTITDFQTYMKNRALQILSTVRNYTLSSKIASSIVDLYKYVVELDDIEAIVSAALSKTPSFRVYLLRDLADIKPQSLEDVLSSLNGIEREALEFALEKASNKSAAVINTYLEYFFISRLSAIVDTFKGDWISKAREIICGYKDYYSSLIAYKMHEQVPDTCKMSKETVRDIANSSSKEEVLDILSRSPYGRDITANDVYYSFAKFKKITRAQARKASLNAFMGSPFTPVTVMGLAELIRLDTEDIITIVNGLALIRNEENKQKVVEDIKSLLSFELI